MRRIVFNTKSNRIISANGQGDSPPPLAKSPSRSFSKLQRIDPNENGKAALLEQAPQLRPQRFAFIAKALDHRGEESAWTKLGEIEGMAGSQGHQPHEGELGAAIAFSKCMDGVDTGRRRPRSRVRSFALGFISAVSAQHFGSSFFGAQALGALQALGAVATEL